MFGTIKRWIRRAVWLVVMLGAAFAAWLLIFAWSDLAVGPPVQFSLKHGSSLRSSIHQMQTAGVIDAPWQFEILARLNGDAARVQAGNYEITSRLTALALLAMITSGAHGQDQVTIVEGWTFSQMRALLDAHPAIRHDTRGASDADLVARLGIPHASPEGWFFPDTYYSVRSSPRSSAVYEMSNCSI